MSVKATARPPKVSNASIVSNLSMYLELLDSKILLTSLLQAADEEIRQNPRFVSLVRSYYSAHSQIKKSEPLTKKLKPSNILLQPIKPVENYAADPSKPHDPYFLLDVYGPEQFTTLLKTLTLPELKASAAIVQKKEGKRPESLTKRASLIAYLLENVSDSGK